MGIIDKIIKTKGYVYRPGALNVPTNSFMNWFRDRISAGNIKIILDYIDSNEYKWVSEAISKQEINSWNNATPIFISAQTGTGKNTFIRKRLLRKVYDDNNNPVYSQGKIDRILLLSNRIALNRQSKLQYADYLYELTGNERYKKIFSQHTKEGIDDHIDFGIIDICSYHQLLERKPLDSNNPYKYIICDECHFFTSDSMFNNKTDEILDYIVSKGKGSIRIYMTATIETVFEAIIRSETKWIEEEIEYCKHYADTQRPNDVVSRFNIQLDFNEGLYPNKMSVDDVIYSKNKTIDYALNDKKLEYSMEFCFYYMSRNYDYIENIYVYENYSELVKVINDSKDKWLIFVPKLPSQNANNELNKISRSKMELSREKINDNGEEKNYYDDIIEQEKFNRDVLITTSLLDNGINISDEKVKNIVIDIFDRVEFIQMLGRVRVKDNQKINLYIKNYTIDDLKKILNIKVNLLTLLLRMDMLSKEECIEYHENIKNSIKYNSWSHNPVRMFKYSNDKGYTYNVNAIIQLLDSASYIFRLIMKVDKNYVVKLNSDDMGRLIKVRKYYAEGEGSHKFWSRSVVDLVETEMGLYDRESNINDEKSGNIPFDKKQLVEEKYSFKFDDTFLHYLYAEMIPNYDFLNETDYAIDIAREEKYNAMRERYKILANTSNIINSLDEQIRWIERIGGYKFLSEKIVSNDAIETEEKYKQSSDDETMKSILSKVITEKEYQEAKVSEDNEKKRDKINKPFTVEKGIKNDSEEAAYIRNNYCSNIGDSTLKGQKFTIGNDSVVVFSAETTGSHETYYFLVRR